MPRTITPPTAPRSVTDTVRPPLAVGHGHEGGREQGDREPPDDAADERDARPPVDPEGDDGVHPPDPLGW